MTRKLAISLVSLALSVSGVAGMRSGWFGGAEKPTLSSSATLEKAQAEAAARHSAGQPRHWRYLMLQQHQ